MKQKYIKDFIKPLAKFSLRNRWVLMILDLTVSAACLAMVYLLHNTYATLQISGTDMLTISTVYLLSNLGISYFFRTYRGLVRHLQFQTIGRLGIYMFIPNFILYVFLAYYMPHLELTPMFVFVLFLFNLVMLLYMRYLLIFIFNYAYTTNHLKLKKTLVYGIREHSFAIVQWLSKSPANSYKIVGYINKMHGVKNTMIDNIPVFDITKEDVFDILKSRKISVIIFPSYKAVRSEQTLLTKCLEMGITILVAPPLEDVQNPESMGFHMKPIHFEDLLGRDEINIDMGLIGSQLQNKVIMVTGAAGSIGSELVRQIAAFKPQKVILFDSAETPLHHLKLELESDYPKLNFIPIIGDVRNDKRLNFVFTTHKPQVIYHAAAYKHVPMMEYNPCEAVLANVLGTKNVADYALKFDVERFVMVSTDKAVNPTNIMGATKRTAEIYVQSLSMAALHAGKQTVFVTTRFGNVLGSNGSVIPYFKNQIETGGPVTVTHPDIIRYFMTIPEACRLVLEAGSFGNSGEIYVFDMGKPVKIADLARQMIEMAGLTPGKDIEIIFTGLREGEKLFEELLGNKETTLPTRHEKINVAQIAKYDYPMVEPVINKLIQYSYDVDIPATVKLMKNLIPEFISKNSPYSMYDVVCKDVEEVECCEKD